MSPAIPTFEPYAPPAVQPFMHIERVESTAREGWHRAECWRCPWTTTGWEPVCEEAAWEHARDRHPRLFLRLYGRHPY